MTNTHDFLWRSDGGFIRIPVWGHIPLIKPLKRIIAHPTFFRLKGVKQLSFAHYVFPGATHTRFEHSIGVYHLMKMILQRVLSNPLTASLQTEAFHFDEYSQRALLVSSLLHDIGHYPHAHILEKIPLSGSAVFDEHEHLVMERLNDTDKTKVSLADIIRDDWQVEPQDVVDLISRKEHRHAKLISGTLDPDKMDYLMRDAHHCSIPYGTIDIERLVESLVPDAELGRFAITEKGIAPLESLMFAKYMMMRNVYWHHTVRTFSLMLQHVIRDALQESILSANQLRALFYHNADERVLYDLQNRLTGKPSASKALIEAILDRIPYKRVFEINFNDHRLLNDEVQKKIHHLANHPDEKRRIELEIHSKISWKTSKRLMGHEIIIDLPTKKHIFDYDDFCRLRVYQTHKQGNHSFVPFNDCGESAFQSEFIHRFEMTTKKIRVVARQDLLHVLKESQEMIIGLIIS